MSPWTLLEKSNSYRPVTRSSLYAKDETKAIWLKQKQLMAQVSPFCCNERDNPRY